MTKTKTQTKKQLIEEVEKLKEFIQSLQGIVCSLSMPFDDAYAC